MRSLPENLRIGLLERYHPPGYRGAVVESLIPLLRDSGAQVELMHAEEGLYRLNTAPPWNIVVLKSASPTALHLAAAAESWGIPCVNSSMATRLAQDKLASAAILQRAGLPIADIHLAWLPLSSDDPQISETFARLSKRPLIVKSARGTSGAGLWKVKPGELAAVVAQLPEGPYLLMDYLAHSGDDLKAVCRRNVAGGHRAALSGDDLRGETWSSRRDSGCGRRRCARSGQPSRVDLLWL